MFLCVDSVKLWFPVPLHSIQRYLYRPCTISEQYRSGADACWLCNRMAGMGSQSSHYGNWPSLASYVLDRSGCHRRICNLFHHGISVHAVLGRPSALSTMGNAVI